jgi:hypothetical protein
MNNLQLFVAALKVSTQLATVASGCCARCTVATDRGNTKERKHMSIMLEIGDREEAIKNAVVAAMEAGKLAAIEAAANTLELDKEDAQVAVRIVCTIWRMIEDGDLGDYALDVLETMRKRGEY